MKKIAILAFADEKDGGVYQYTQSIIEALKDDSNKYIIICNKGDIRFDDYGLEVRKIDKPKYNIFQKTIKFLQLLFNIRKPLFFNEKEFNVFNDIDMFFSPIINAYPHFYLNKQFVFTLHDLQVKYYPEFFSMFQKIMRTVLYTRLSKNASKIICESSFVRNDIIKFLKIDNTKINIIQSPPSIKYLDFKLDKNEAQKIISKYNLPKRFIFYPAQCWHHKNHIRLVEAFKLVSAEIADVHLILTGSQQNNYDNLINKIEDFNLESKVKHLGYIDYDDLPYLYKLSEFLVMPTLFESISIPIYEAFSLKTPVCSSNAVALPEQVGEAGLLFDPFNIKDISSKMLEYLLDNKLKEEKAEKGFLKLSSFDFYNYKLKLKRVIHE